MRASFLCLKTSLAAAILAGLASCVSAPPGPVEVNLVAINDFHGMLEAHEKEYEFAGQPKRKIRVGGIANLSGALKAFRAEDPELIVVGGGDMVGATPAMSSMWADEPTIEALNLLGLRVTSVGNHEFDRGTDELLRQQKGGCGSPAQPGVDKTCKLRPQFGGARYHYLASNVVNKNGTPFMPAWRVEEVKGIKIGFIGAVVRDTAHMVMPAGVAKVDFIDEVEAINRAAADLKQRGDVAAIVVLIHQGGTTVEQFDKPDCSQLKGPIVDIVKRLDPAIRLIVSAHTHNGYQCKVDDRVVTQAESFGHVLTRIKMTIDPATRTVRDIGVRNVLIEDGKFAPDEAQAKLVAEVRARSNEFLQRPIAKLAVPLVTDKLDEAGESPLGDLATDAQLAATKALGAQLVFINHKSLRVALEAGPAGATYAQVAATHPYGNTLVLMTLTGAQIRAALEQQNQVNGDSAAGRRTLQVSNGFSYRWDAKQPRGQRVIAGSMMLNGAAIEPDKTYRVAVNSFMSQGGDAYTVFKEGTDRVDSHILDLDAIIDYLSARDKAGKPAGTAASVGRIVRVN